MLKRLEHVVEITKKGINKKGMQLGSKTKHELPRLVGTVFTPKHRFGDNDLLLSGKVLSEQPITITASLDIGELGAYSIPLAAGGPDFTKQ